MEDLPIASTPVIPLVESVQNPSFFNRFSPKRGKSFLLLFVILGILALGGGMFAYNNSQESKEGGGGENQEQVGQFISDNVIVYGYWVGDRAIVAVHNLKNNSSGILATLPTNVKHVKVTSPTTILYIAETDERDHGKTITERNLETGEDTVVFTADTDFGIDDYAVSPNGKYISIWEVKMPEDSEVLINGTSRVVNLDRATNQRYTIYDEIFGTSNPVHYPIGITDTGDLFTDRFLANSGAGWAYGMSKSNLTGSQKSDIPGMTNGTYSSQPIMSPDGKYIAFAGYPGVNGAQEVNGFRKALSNPETVEIIDVVSLARRVLLPKVSNVKYFSLIWDVEAENIFAEQGQFLEDDFNLRNLSVNAFTGEARVIQGRGISEQLYSSLSNEKNLFVERESGETFMGNLSGKYSPAVKKLNVYDSQKNTDQEVGMDQEIIQLIDITASSYFPETLYRQVLSKNRSEDQLQLATLEIKPELAPKRNRQQSQPPDTNSCERDIGACCNQLAIEACGGPENEECRRETLNRWIAQGTCLDSPLYLYGEEGQKVSVQVGVPLYSPNIPYSPERGVDAEISSNGSFYANGKLIEGFSFDYIPGIKKIQRPEYGIVVARSDLEKTLKSYTQKLGLNKKETTDLLNETSSITSNFQYVSFFGHNTSHKILPLYFTPKPDTYRNIVFYVEEFETKPNLKPKIPVFNEIEREELTAVEVSVMKR